MTTVRNESMPLVRLRWMGMEWPEGMTKGQIVDQWDLAEEMMETERGREWAQTQIGDVPVRTTWLDRMAEKDPDLALAFALFQGQEPVRDYFGETVPIDSLGRNHDG